MFVETETEDDDILKCIINKKEKNIWKKSDDTLKSRIGNIVFIFQILSSLAWNKKRDASEAQYGL